MTGDYGYLRAVAMDGSDNAIAKNVSEPFVMECSPPGYAYASGAGLFVVVIVKVRPSTTDRRPHHSRVVGSEKLAELGDGTHETLIT